MQRCVGVTQVNGRFLKVCVLKNCRLNILAVGSSEFTGCLQMEVPETTRLFVSCRWGGTSSRSRTPDLPNQSLFSGRTQCGLFVVLGESKDSWSFTFYQSNQCKAVTTPGRILESSEQAHPVIVQYMHIESVQKVVCDVHALNPYPVRSTGWYILSQVRVIDSVCLLQRAHRLHCTYYFVLFFHFLLCC